MYTIPRQYCKAHINDKTGVRFYKKYLSLHAATVSSFRCLFGRDMFCIHTPSFLIVNFSLLHFVCHLIMTLGRYVQFL